MRRFINNTFPVIATLCLVILLSFPALANWVTQQNESGYYEIVSSDGSTVGFSIDSAGAQDINSGTIDGTTIGANSASTGVFTTLTGTGDITLGDVSDTELHILDGATLTTAEVNLLDGTVVGNTVASKVPLLDSAKALRTDANVGTAGTGVTAVEYGDGYNHVTVLTLSSAALTPTTIPADAEGAGVIIYTFPVGDYLFTACHMDITAFTGTGFSATNAVDIGLGSLISSCDIFTLPPAAMEDCVTGQTVADISSPATEKSNVATAGAPLLFEAAGSHVIHLNVAGTWNDTFTDPIVTGTVTIYWTFLGA